MVGGINGASSANAEFVNQVQKPGFTTQQIQQQQQQQTDQNRIDIAKVNKSEVGTNINTFA